MAKVSVHGSEYYRYEVGNRRYRIMSDGITLRQLRIDGTWERPNISKALSFKGNPARAKMALDGLRVLDAIDLER